MFPDYLDGAKVLKYTEPGHFGFITDYDATGNPIEREIRYLSLCAYTGDTNCYLFYCDEIFDVISDFLVDTSERLEDSCPRAVWQPKKTPYFYTAAQRKALGGTCYFEFQRGRYRGKHWLERSIYIHMDQFDDLHLFELFSKSLSHFDYFGLTEVTPVQYEKLKSLALSQGGAIAELLQELDYWVQNCFLTENVFTICGI
jgi:hypothetical protein